MHGSSSVPQELQEEFNRYGGAMPQTWGVPVEEIQRGIKHGVRKVNIDTDCRLAMAAQIRRVAQQKPEEFDPRKFLQPSIDALKRLCKQRYEEFGTAGQAAKIKTLPLGEMTKRYRSGALDPRTSVAAAAE
jgi:fructose-bisphosphate aldolase class II